MRWIDNGWKSNCRPSREPRPKVAKHRIRPWHKVVRLKEELRNDELSLAEFAADLHEVTMGKGRRAVYEDADKFFALTYPTHALRELVKDVALRLRGQSDKAVRQLELTYGGGKTHTLIALYHLFRNPEGLPDLAAVREFRGHVESELPRAFAVALCFDKIDVERGIEEVRAPDGETRTLRHPWSVLAFQLAGGEGLRSIHGEGRDEERETPPAEPLLAKLIAKPQERGLATLILVDEVLMYAREKASMDPVWRDRIKDFFQYLTQAVVKVDRAAMVASLLATDPGKQQGELGSALMSGLFDVVGRQREKGVQPVQKQDVAEVLRRRFFVPEDVRDRDAFRPHAIAVVQGLARLDDALSRERPAEEARFLESFPFHPDLTDVLYSRWTQLAGFQRTRGTLRILATALRDAEAWDTNPLIGPAVLLAAPGSQGISEAARELAGVASTEPAEDRHMDWSALLEAELGKARQIQDELPALANGREAEQAVMAVFLHSQPTGAKANASELTRAIGSLAPDAIELEKGLRRWRDISWFLDDDDLGADEAARGLPKSWRLGNRPNLRQMHDESCRQRVSAEAVEECLDKAVRATRALTDGARAAGAVLHLLPPSPRDVGDDGSFRYLVLGPGAACDSGKPNPLARRFLDEAGPERPRVHRNAVVAVAPSLDGLEAARAGARALLGWEDVQGQLQEHRIDAVQKERLRRRLQEARERLPDVIRQGWSTVVTVDEHNAVHAFRLRGGTGPLFAEIKNDERARIRETAVNAAALLPDGPYDVWRQGEEARFVKELAEAFTRHPHLPKVLNAKVLLGTAMQGVERGLLVARLARPDGSARSWWHEAVDPDSLRDAQLEAVLPEKAVLSHLSESLLTPGALPQLWAAAEPASLREGEAPAVLNLQALKDYFSGGREVSVANDEGYDDLLVVPRCPEEAILEAAQRGVEQGTLWLVNGPTSLWKEPVPHGVFEGKDAAFRPPPALLAPQELSEEALPGAWQDGKSNGAALVRVASQARGEPLPWGLMRESIRNAVTSRWLHLADGSGPIDCGYDQAGQLRLERPTESPPPPPPPPPGDVVLKGHQIQDLGEAVGKLMSAAAGSDLRFHVRVTVGEEASDETRAALNKILATVSDDLKTG